MKFQLRSADNKSSLNDTAWTGPAGPDTYYTKHNQPIPLTLKGDWIQYRAVLDTYNGATSPILDMVEIMFE